VDPEGLVLLFILLLRQHNLHHKTPLPVAVVVLQELVEDPEKLVEVVD
jgi:hypothetical protein